MKKPIEEKKRQKREAILESAKVVFSKKGLIDATMQDIIEECGISRGGIYRFNEVRAMIKANASFETILTKYFEDHKYRLLHSISDSMLRATYEYYYTHKSIETSSLQQTQLTETKRTIQEIFQVGVAQGVIADRNLEAIAENYMFVIEGLGILALTGHIQEEQIDHQIQVMRTLLPYQ